MDESYMIPHHSIAFWLERADIPRPEVKGIS
jgi:hypothetical protein